MKIGGLNINLDRAKVLTMLIFFIKVSLSPFPNVQFPCMLRNLIISSKSSLIISFERVVQEGIKNRTSRIIWQINVTSVQLQSFGFRGIDLQAVNIYLYISLACLVNAGLNRYAFANKNKTFKAKAKISKPAANNGSDNGQSCLKPRFLDLKKKA